MILEWQCPCDRSFGTRHRRDFAVEGDMVRTLTDGTRETHDWRRHAAWLTTEGPATRLWLDYNMVWDDGHWLHESARSSCLDRTDAYIDALLGRTLVTVPPLARNPNLRPGARHGS